MQAFTRHPILSSGVPEFLLARAGDFWLDARGATALLMGAMAPLVSKRFVYGLVGSAIVAAAFAYFSLQPPYRWLTEIVVAFPESGTNRVRVYTVTSVQDISEKLPQEISAKMRPELLELDYSTRFAMVAVNARVVNFIRGSSIDYAALDRSYSNRICVSVFAGKIKRPVKMIEHDRD
jgi:hypothetical protein